MQCIHKNRTENPKFAEIEEVQMSLPEFLSSCYLAFCGIVLIILLFCGILLKTNKKISLDYK